MSNDDVIRMVREGVRDDVVMAKISAAGRVVLDVSAEALAMLKRSGVSAKVLDAMIRRASSSGAARSSAPSRSGMRPARRGP